VANGEDVGNVKGLWKGGKVSGRAGSSRIWFAHDLEIQRASSVKTGSCKERGRRLRRQRVFAERVARERYSGSKHGPRNKHNRW